MLKKTSASIGLVIATAAGILLSGAPAQAQTSSVFGCRTCFHSRHHSSNWNGNRTRPRIFIRVFIYNRNNNVAVARNGQRQRQRDLQLQRERRRRRGLGIPMAGAQDLRGRGVIAPAPLTGPTRAHSVNQPVNAVPQIAPDTRPAPRDNGQVSRNGVVRSFPNTGAQQSRPGAEEAGQNGITANPGINNPDQDIASWLNPALS